ncbi:hypothetical protein BC835DRAFT_1340949 [Cytidiella melzeri]|nr:hypothetical protein BC835DRAFT_1340949 [Cytidiella melzeri]
MSKAFTAASTGNADQRFQRRSSSSSPLSRNLSCLVPVRAPAHPNFFMMKYASLFVALLASTAAVLASPTKTRATASLCDVSTVTLTIPSSTSGTPLASPLSSGPKYIGLAVGTQNYTCGSAGTYTSAGALAELFDISCLPPSTFNGLTTAAYVAWEAAPASVTPQDIIDALAGAGSPEVLGQHYFITNASGGLSPKWDFTSASMAGNPNAYVVGVRTGDIPAPTDPTVNVDWLSLSNGGGELAEQIFRVQTRGGQPPSSMQCAPGSAEIYVRYTAQYCECPYQLFHVDTRQAS